MATRKGNPVIPAEAVRAAFIALYERDHIGGVGSADIRRALEAAAPHLMAQAWDEGREADDFEVSIGMDGNPYRKTPHGDD